MAQQTTDDSVLAKIQSLAHEEERLYGHNQLTPWTPWAAQVAPTHPAL
jgi:hypothetical protein